MARGGFGSPMTKRNATTTRCLPEPFGWWNEANRLKRAKLLAVVLNTEPSPAAEGEASTALANTDVVNEIRSDFPG